MSPRLHWRAAESRDRPALRAFRCATDLPETPDGRVLPHPARWHREVHVGLRSLLPPYSDSVVLLGEDGLQRLVAVAFLCDVEQSDGVFIMKLVAVGVALECQGEGYGVEAIEMAIQTAETRGFGAGAWLVTVVGQVHVRNTASKKACQQAGLSRFGVAGEYEEWGASIELPAEMRQG